ncbi:ATP-dependent DNA helicase RecQ [Clostridium baratii]|uniref:DNA helicase RecQ n=1 Tax=Clostridium baratii TaxID=1561 RepID=A0A174TJ76_9CLOT|nr:DNA helicase RecQ [Clostridium baratii]OPF52616.1 ATP-dependent DNA helicase RecQ [Clostridium baratii]OPF56065.1 ATP-dependent DNA helicase RecQ [Clostridium baratii]OPF58340.1 ATP-dependent DNA helicase RecQ [Clostridium baratii]OPF59553.1 ATP-dependent DNA helicase RecQ [Clostridium baratii]CUQ06949.1 ATP-dependent DNA helicase RecQ [Clostridium baratii]
MKDALNVLKSYFGYSSFRKGQEEIINEIINKKDVVAIMPTGGGKSICYQVPALILDGITIVISPLISLMKDQVDGLNSMGINSAYINSSLSNLEINDILLKVKNEDIKILYIAPERLESMEFLNTISNAKVALIAVDEAHCVSQWGHDFRSSYRRISKFINILTERPIVSAFTATATKEVREDIVKLLDLNYPKVFISGFDRENLKIIIEKGINKKAYILNYINANLDSSGIIYCATRKEVDSLYELLDESGLSVTRYHAGLSDDERKVNQEDFVYDRKNIIIATNAFGMGIDKPNIRYVIHYNMPKNIEGYYQEIGRAGRDSEKSECILLFSPGDVQKQKYIIDMGTVNPTRKVNELEKLQTMTDLVYYTGCYRRYILNYFGEELKEDCGNCSSCEFDGEVIDKTIDAQKVISCVYRMKRPYGIGMIVDVLRGSKNKKLVDFKLNELTTYGIMKDYSKDDLKEFINTLIANGYLNYNGEFPVVTPNEKSRNIVMGEEKVLFKEERKVQRIAEDNELFIILKNLRREIAENEGVPPYIVFGDNTLKEMSLRMPINKEQLLDISGVGEKKIDKYGDEFINTVKEYIENNSLEVKFEFLNAKNKTTNSKTSKKVSDKKKSFEITIEELKEGRSFIDIAKDRDITVSTVMSHIYKYLSDGEKIDFKINFTNLFTKEDEEEVIRAINKVGYNKLKPIKEEVRDDISYDTIKYIILKYTLDNNIN